MGSGCKHFVADQFNIIICCRRWLLSKLFEEIRLDDTSSCSPDTVTHQYGEIKSSSTARVSCSNVISHSDLRHCIVLRELSVCHTAADRYHSNYNAWNHRIWVMDKFACCRTQVNYVLFQSKKLPHKLTCQLERKK